MYVVRVHLSRPVQVKGKGDRGDPDVEISSLWREVYFVSTSWGAREGVPMPLNR